MRREVVALEAEGADPDLGSKSKMDIGLSMEQQVW